MLMNRAKSLLSVVLLSGAATLGSIGSAQAAIYTGSWDPAYGGIFPSLGWQASGLFDLPDACAAIGTGSNIPISGNCAGFDVLSAKVEFYNIANPGTILASFSLNPNVNVTGIDLTAGKLSGIDTNFFDFFVPTLDIAGGGTYSFSLILFGGTQAQLIYADPTTVSPGLRPISGAGHALRTLGQLSHRRIRAGPRARDLRPDARRPRRPRLRRPQASPLAICAIPACREAPQPDVALGATSPFRQ